MRHLVYRLFNGVSYFGPDRLAWWFASRGRRGLVCDPAIGTSCQCRDREFSCFAQDWSDLVRFAQDWSNLVAPLTTEFIQAENPYLV